MSIRPRTIAVAAIAAALAAAIWFLLPSRVAATPEERIRALFDEAAKAAEKRKVDEVVRILSERFTGGGEGQQAGRDDVRRMLAFELLRGQWVSVSISAAEVSVDGSRARANVDAVLSRSADPGKGLASLLPGEASAHRFRLALEEEGGEWRVVSGSWRRIGLEEALSGPGAPDW